MKKNNFIKRYLFVASQVFLLLLISCNAEIEQPNTVESAQLKLMPNEQNTYLLDYRDGKSFVYRVSYDFQGLKGKAILTPIVSVDGPAHLTITPSAIAGIDPSLIIVNNGVDAHKVYVVPVAGSESIDANLYLAPQYGFDLYALDGGGVGKITQVDFDQNNHLFIAGASGFFEVYYGSKSSSALLGYDIYNATTSQHQLLAKPFVMGGSIVDLLNQEELGWNSGSLQLEGLIEKPVFSGGDLLFTQNSTETAQREMEALISFTQADDQAMVVEIAQESHSILAHTLFNLRKNRTKYASNSDGLNNNVTGAALLGDNLFITSHFNSNTFSVWNVNGEELATPIIQFPIEAPSGWILPSDGKLAWGDMASYQFFDTAGLDDLTTLSGRMILPSVQIFYAQQSWPWAIPGMISIHHPWRPQFAETKLYRPSTSVQGNKLHYEGANANIADLRYFPTVYSTLGTKGGEIIMKFDEAFNVSSDSRLHIAMHKGKSVSFNNFFSGEAIVYVSSHESDEIGDWINHQGNWVRVNEKQELLYACYYPLYRKISKVKWVKIVSNKSTPLSVNFAAIYDYNIDIN